MKNFIALTITLSFGISPPSFANEGTCDFVRHLELGGDRLTSPKRLPSWSINPSRSTIFDTNHFIMESSATLFRRLENGIGNELAQKFEFDSDNQVATIALNQNCRWSDGNPITAENYVDTFKMIFDPLNETYIPGRGIFNNGNEVWKGQLPFEDLGIRVQDDFTLEFDLAVPESLFKAVMSYVSYTPAPSHILKNQPDYWDDYQSAKVVSGPYMHVMHDDEKILLEPNPFYCDRSKQNFDHIKILKTDTESEVGNLIFESEVDIAGRLPARQIRMFSASDTILENYDIFDVDDEVLYYFVQSAERIKNQKIREALGSALDFGYLESNTLGYFLGLADSFAYRYEGYNPPKINQNLVDYDERIANARKVLAEHGYTEEKPLKLTFKTGGNEIYRYLGEGIIAMLRQLNVEVTELDSSKTSNYETDIILSGWGSDYADPENFLTSMVSRHTSVEGRAVMNDLLERASLARSPEERFDLLEKVEVELYKDKTIFPISWFKTDWLIKKNFKKQKGFYYLGRNFKRTDCSPKHLL